MVPDADGHLFSLGIGYEQDNVSIDLASMVMFFPNRHTRRNIDDLNGKYTSTTVTLLISLTYRF